MPEGSHRAERSIHERLRRAAVKDRANVLCDGACFTNRMLGQGRVGLAVGAGDRGAVADRPHVRITDTPHRCVSDDATTPVSLDRDRGGDLTRYDAGCEHDRVGLDEAVLPSNHARLDLPDPGGGMTLGAATLQNLLRVGGYERC